jgi:hypothetical protein
MTDSCQICESLATELVRLEAIQRLKVWQLDDGRREAERVDDLDYARLQLAEVEARLDCAWALLAIEEHKQTHGV